MTVLPLLAGVLMTLFAILFVLCSIILILVVLVQKGRGGGLSGALGGGMASGILGSKTGDFLTWATIVLAGVFLLVAIILSKFYKPPVSDYGTGQTQTAPVSAPAGQPAAKAPAIPAEEKNVIPTTPASSGEPKPATGSVDQNSIKPSGS
jgi:preprotein translocase subunit SecG